MVRRLDLLGECNDKQVPFEDFKLQFCVRCAQPECTRSTFGTTKFDQRVNTWMERLFTEVPRMDSSDPRFSSIQAKQFKMFNPPVQAQVSDWLDPNDLPDELPPLPVVENPTPPLVIPEAPMLEVPADEPVLVQPVTAATTPSAPKPTETKPVPLTPHLLRMNTPAQKGVMLSGSAPKPAPPAKDPWEAPVPAQKTKDGVVVVKRGATVRLGGNGVE